MSICFVFYENDGDWRQVLSSKCGTRPGLDIGIANMAFSSRGVTCPDCLAELEADKYCKECDNERCICPKF